MWMWRAWYYPFVLKNCGLDGVCHGSNKTLMKKVILTEDEHMSISPNAQRGLRRPTEKAGICWGSSVLLRVGWEEVRLSGDAGWEGRSPRGHRWGSGRNTDQEEGQGWPRPASSTRRMPTSPSPDFATRLLLGGRTIHFLQKKSH